MEGGGGEGRYAALLVSGLRAQTYVHKPPVFVYHNWGLLFIFPLLVTGVDQYTHIIYERMACDGGRFSGQSSTVLRPQM